MASKLLILWWSRPGSNRRPLECHSSALPTELRPHVYLYSTYAGKVSESQTLRFKRGVTACCAF